ncbi:MAG: hypothetical protein ACNA8W_14765 [Bradymonadaceae bacterium]
MCATLWTSFIIPEPRKRTNSRLVPVGLRRLATGERTGTGVLDALEKFPLQQIARG